MVGDNTERYVGLFVFLVFNACNARNMLHCVLNGVNLKKVVHALHNAGKSL